MFGLELSFIWAGIIVACGADVNVNPRRFDLGVGLPVPLSRTRRA